uniref:Uncharacterized protein n=1 Tax=Chrysotila carterae TaxID=13221 RepID=A0A7S4FC13_CHRCT|mmetsp:Transcript_11405/g.24388  ORF Transcript_11405/g.24388 Transcript_11405/m.24388 type:complete len:324 (-) Transcript_11405:252-1223(-)|eukprot:4311047-Pleurochrysis_carterae.AAC.1
MAAELNSMAKLVVAEYPYQRMHKHSAPPAKQLDLSDNYRTTNQRSFAAPRQHDAIKPVFTMGSKNDIGTKNLYQRLTLDEMRSQRLQTAGSPTAPTKSTAQQAYVQPNQAHQSQGRAAPRSGVAPRMPYSEVSRGFGSLDSTGTMPGGKGEFKSTSETRRAYPAHTFQRIPAQQITIGKQNDIGSHTSYSCVPSKDMHTTNYSLGTYTGKRFVSTEMERRAPPNATHSAAPAAGQKAPPGPSEVDRGFRQPSNSSDYNIISNGPRLNGERNRESALDKRSANAFAVPCGRKQNPDVKPTDRGPIGSRQAYDIITGADRPKSRW